MVQKKIVKRKHKSVLWCFPTQRLIEGTTVQQFMAQQTESFII
jgi:hypothetical protein